MPDVNALKRSLRITSTDQDTLLAECLERAQGRVETILGFTLEGLTDYAPEIDQAIIVLAQEFFKYDGADIYGRDAASGLSRIDHTLNALLMNHRSY